VFIIALTLVGLTFLGWFFYTLRSLFGMLFIAVFLAVAAEPVVQKLNKRGVKRWVAALIVVIGLLLLMIALVLLVVPAFVSSIVNFVAALPQYVEDFTAWLGQYVDLGSFDPSTIDYTGLGNVAGNLLGAVFSWGSGFLGGIGQAITILLFAYYGVAQQPEIRRGAFSFMTPQRQKEANFIWEVSVEKTGSYFYSRFILGLLIGTYSLILFLILGLPHAFALAVFVAIVAELIPVIGTYIAMIVPALVALFIDPMKALWVIVFLVIYQGIENLFLLPRVTSKTMEIHPAVSIAAVIAGSALFGPIGIFLALPITAIIQSIISTYVNRYELIPELVAPVHSVAADDREGADWWRFWDRDREDDLAEDGSTASGEGEDGPMPAPSPEGP
jgi:predicted PurR-regulated permease PerM